MMDSCSQYRFYRDLIIITKRGNYRGKISNAKPVFIISLIDAISESVFTDNKLCFGNKDFEYIYYRNSAIYHNNTKIILPFYHLDTSEYYSIKWRQKYNGGGHTPSTRFMLDNVEYAYLDNALWDLLQDKETRKTIREEIVRFFKLDVNN